MIVSTEKPCIVTDGFSYVTAVCSCGFACEIKSALMSFSVNSIIARHRNEQPDCRVLGQLVDKLDGEYGLTVHHDGPAGQWVSQR